MVRVSADGPFGPVERVVQTVKEKPGDLRPDPCAPIQRFVSVAGRKTGLSSSLMACRKCEARLTAGALAAQLRSDVARRYPERPGNAGWPRRPRGAMPGRSPAVAVTIAPAGYASGTRLRPSSFAPPVACAAAKIAAVLGVELIARARVPAMKAGRIGLASSCAVTTRRRRQFAVRGAWVSGALGRPVGSTIKPVKRLRWMRTAGWDRCAAEAIVTILLR